VATGQTIVPGINQLREEKGCLFDMIIRSRDYHPAGHISYGTTHFPSQMYTDVSVGAPFNVHCTKAASGLLKDSECCLVDVNQAACEGLAAPGCVVGPDPDTNPACSACADDPDSCVVLEQAMWTDHCLQTGDSVFAEGLLTPDTDVVLEKGTNKWIDAYSVFMDNAKTHRTPLEEMLREHGIEKIYITGIATDFCVAWTAEDARSADLLQVKKPFDVTVIEDLTAPIGIPVGGGVTTVDLAMDRMREKGVKFAHLSDILAMDCPAVSCGDGCQVAEHHDRRLLFASLPNGCPEGCVPMPTGRRLKLDS
jgi:nicotinamidase-related amidase